MGTGRAGVVDGRLQSMNSFAIAPLEDEDLAFVREMLYEAAFWRPAIDRPPLEAALSEPDLAGTSGAGDDEAMEA